MADIKISELTTASEIKNEDNIELSQSTGSGLVSLKATILALATKIVTAINFTSALNTSNKTITGAINEAAASGGTDVIAEDFDSTATYAVGDYCIYNGNLYKCTTAVTTAGDWDSSDWTETLVMDEVEQGGGGTGGHTIIDENGNSMTARAGLQFVGGANVSDDATNNKTIVDLASAGGIDGVFIDTGNVIQAETHITSESTYTATEDCFVIYKCEVKNSAPLVYINNTLVGGIYLASSFDGTLIQSVMLKKGQVLKLTPDGSNPSMYYSVYGIQTGTTHSKFQPVIYSTEEREIGVWTDGKPLYEKTFDLGSDTDISYNSWTETTISWQTMSVERLVGAKGFTSSGGTFAGTLLGSKKSNGKVEIQTPRNNYNSGVRYLTLQYTKSTDTAGSGAWTPQGVPAVHYSTDEHVIGTWIDGSTLYEKTFTTSNTTQNAEVNIDASSLNIDTCVYVGGIYTRKSTGYSFKYPFGQLEPNSSPQIGSFIRYGDINKNITYKIVLSTNESTDYQHITIQYTKSS